MDLRSSIRDFILRAKELQLQLRRSDEAATLTRSDLHMLEVQMYLLDKEVQKMKEVNRVESWESLATQPGSPPMTSAKDPDVEEQKS